MDRLFVETKFLTDEAGAISGIAWKFDQPDRIGDVIEKGAFADTPLPLPMLFGHDQNEPIGTWDIMAEKSDGLHIEGKMLVDDVVRAREVSALVKAGSITGISIGFITKKANARPGGGRTIKQLEMLEVSLVTLPMHPGAKITSAKSAVEAISIAAAINRATAQLAAR